MPIKWQDKEVADRILAAIIASQDNKINCKEVARLFGEDATYDSIEGFLRKPKKMATQLKREAAGREAPAKKTASPKTSPTKKTTSAKTSPAKKATPAKTSPAKKNADGVKTGRIEKKTHTKKVKTEEVEEDEEYEG